MAISHSQSSTSSSLYSTICNEYHTSTFAKGHNSKGWDGKGKGFSPVEFGRMCLTSSCQNMHNDAMVLHSCSAFIEQVSWKKNLINHNRYTFTEHGLCITEDDDDHTNLRTFLTDSKFKYMCSKWSSANQEWWLLTTGNSPQQQSRWASMDGKPGRSHTTVQHDGSLITRGRTRWWASWERRLYPPQPLKSMQHRQWDQLTLAHQKCYIF